MATTLQNKFQTLLTVTGLAGLLSLLPACTQATSQDRAALAQGFANYTSQHYDSAQSAADMYIQKYPEDPNVDEAYYLRGMARKGQGTTERGSAAQDLNKLLRPVAHDEKRALRLRAPRERKGVGVGAAPEFCCS